MMKKWLALDRVVCVLTLDSVWEIGRVDPAVETAG